MHFISTAISAPFYQIGWSGYTELVAIFSALNSAMMSVIC
jgi:hypothetical protein